MAVTWRFEAWTHPRLGTPTRVVGSLPFTRAQLADREDAIVDSWIEIPAARRSDIEALLNIDPETISNSRSRIIRAYRVDTVDPVPVDGSGERLPDHEFVAADLTWRIVEGGVQLAKIAGPDLRGSLDDAAVLAYDYPANPTTARDWQWNGPNLFDNGDLENLSAEIQWFYIEGIGAGDTYTVTFDGQTTTALTWGADANVRLDELEAALQALSNLDDVEIIGEGTIVDPFEILFVDPAGEDLPTISVTPSVGTATLGTISTGGFPSIEGWTKAYNPVTGIEFGQYTEFRSTSPDYGETGLDGSAGAVTMTIPAGPESRFSGGQVILSVTPGTMLQLSIDAKCTSTVDTFRFVVRDLVGDTESRLKSTTEQTFAAVGVEQTFTLDDVKVRPHVDRVLVRFALTTVGGPVDALQLVLDNLVVQEGFRGTSKGGIVATVHNDLAVAHAPRTRLDWVSLGFDVTNDSSGVPWADPDLPYVVRHGMRFGSHVLGGLQELGSLWDLVPLTPTTWRLDLWDEANKGTDHSTDPAIAFLIGQIADGSIQHRLPAETRMLAVGEGGVWVEVEDPDLVAAFGPIDGYVENDDWLDTATVTAAATEHLSREAQNALSVKAVTSSAKGAIPWKQVAVGDRAKFTLGTVARHTRRIRQCTVTITPDSWSAEWVASRVFIGESATQEAIRRMLTEWDRRRFGLRRQTGSPMAPPAVAAPAGRGAYIHLARATTQSIAGTGEAISWDVLSPLGHSNFAPTVPVTGVTILRPGYYNVAVQAAWASFTGGGTVTVRRVREGVTTDVWPPSEDPGLWSTSAAAEFEGTAPAIPCNAGDEIEVVISPDDASAQTLASATVAVYLVDHTGADYRYRELVLSHGPEAYWRLGETTGPTAVDETGNGHDGTYTGTGETLGAAGLITDDPNPSVHFDGAAGHVDMGEFLGNGWAAITLEAWIYEDTTTRIAVIAGRDKFGEDTPNPYAIVGFNNGAWDFRIHAGGVYHNLNTPASTGRHYLAFTYDGTTFSAYVDGQLVGSEAASGAIQTDSTLPFRIGNYSDGGGVYPGRIDEVAIYERALSSFEIQEHWRVGTGVG